MINLKHPGTPALFLFSFFSLFSTFCLISSCFLISFLSFLSNLVMMDNFQYLDFLNNTFQIRSKKRKKQKVNLNRDQRSKSEIPNGQ